MPNLIPPRTVTDADAPENSPPFKSPEDLVNERLIWTYQAWRKLCGPRSMPRRSEMTPAMFKSALAIIFLADVIDGGADFRLALAGDKLMQFLGEQFRPGALLSQIAFVGYQKRTARLFQHCVTAKTSVALGPSRSLHDERSHLDIEVVVLPLSEDGHSVTALVGAAYPTPAIGV